MTLEGFGQVEGLDIQWREAQPCHWVGPRSSLQDKCFIGTHLLRKQCFCRYACATFMANNCSKQCVFVCICHFLRKQCLCRYARATLMANDCNKQCVLVYIRHMAIDCGTLLDVAVTQTRDTQSTLVYLATCVQPYNATTTPLLHQALGRCNDCMTFDNADPRKEYKAV